MSTPWTVAYIALAVAVALLAMMMLGLTRRVLEVLERVEGFLTPLVSGEELDRDGLRDGDQAPLLPRHAGAALARQPSAGDLVVFLEVGCEPCRVLAADVARRRFNPTPYRAVVVIDHPEEMVAMPSNWVVLSDLRQELTRAWRVSGTPIAFAVDQTGTIRARGIVNSVKDVKTLLKKAEQLGPQTKPQQSSTGLNPPKLEMSRNEH